MVKWFFQHFLHIVFLVLRPLTLGVRAICHDRSDNTVLLVKHTYSNGWSLPGGGVETAQSTTEAIIRELKEEVGLTCQVVEAICVYHNKSISKRDHVVIYDAKSWTVDKSHILPKWEISDICWYRLDELPKELYPCTRYALDIYIAKLVI